MIFLLQIEFGNEELSPMKCPIFRTELGGATVTECGLCMCSHCFSQRKDDLDELCNVCGKSISSHHIVEMEKASENILRSHYLTIEQLEGNLLLEETSRFITIFNFNF
jgi:hypothetical protein